MGRADYVFDVLILGPLNEDRLPEFGLRKNGIIAKDESAAKMKAVKFAQEAGDGDKIDLDKVEFVVTRPFVAKTWEYIPVQPWVPVPAYVPYYVPAAPAYPRGPDFPGSWDWYATCSNDCGVTVRIG